MNDIYDENLMHDLFAYRIQLLDESNNEQYIIRKLKVKLISFGYLEDNLNMIIYSFYNFFDIPITLSEIENIPSIDYHPLQFFFNQTPNLPNSLMSLLPPNLNGIYYINMNVHQVNNNPASNPVDLNNNPENLDNNPEDNDDNPEDNDDNIDENEIIIDMNIGALMREIYLNQLNQPNQLNQLNQSNQLNLQFAPLMNDVVVTTDENTLNTLNVLKITKEMNEKCTICIEDMNEDDEYFDINCKHVFHKDCLNTYLKNYNHICPICRNEIGNSLPHIN